MLKRLALAGFLAAGPCTCIAAAQAPTAAEVVDSFGLTVVVDTALPPWVVATTLCTKLPGTTSQQPVVVVRTERPNVASLVHEAVHVAQIERYGGCPKGWEWLVANAERLLAAEVEAWCVHAWWLAAYNGSEPQQILALAERWLYDASVERVKVEGKRWQLERAQIAVAFRKGCPSNMPEHIPGTTSTTEQQRDNASGHYEAETSSRR
jgi:hypothetical protein